MGGPLSLMLEARAAEFSYAAGPPVIRGVSLGIAGGKLTALIGSNGCGKSTLIRWFAGLLTPQRGEIRAYSITRRRGRAARAAGRDRASVLKVD